MNESCAIEDMYDDLAQSSLTTTVELALFPILTVQNLQMRTIPLIVLS